MLSPTRTFLPLIKEILSQFGQNTEGVSSEKKGGIHGIIHSTGGGQTKVSKFIKDKHIIKNNMFSEPPLFKMIQEESKTDWREMFQVFNMGTRLEIYCDADIADKLIAIGKSFNIDAQVIGFVENTEGGERLTIESDYGTFKY